MKMEDEKDQMVMMELGRLKEEQRVLDETIRGIGDRIKATERKPQQAMAFLVRIAENPDLLHRFLLSSSSNRVNREEADPESPQQKRRLLTHTVTEVAPSPPSPPPPPPPPPLLPTTTTTTTKMESSSTPSTILFDDGHEYYSMNSFIKNQQDFMPDVVEDLGEVVEVGLGMNEWSSSSDHQCFRSPFLYY
ncbi:Heat stress transcription factor C-1 [Acorus gramineus]|uniref:Heat stress transcription factor C-1 n=1 Tax=Acorus gramineus TaxID=55184 RepID=A0AAV9ASF2_ACOGR|nr:Heat stress transcription factor C-1 [Acorus gramineus]